MYVVNPPASSVEEKSVGRQASGLRGRVKMERRSYIGAVQIDAAIDEHPIECSVEAHGALEHGIVAADVLRRRRAQAQIRGKRVCIGLSARSINELGSECADAGRKMCRQSPAGTDSAAPPVALGLILSKCGMRCTRCSFAAGVVTIEKWLSSPVTTLSLKPNASPMMRPRKARRRPRN